MTASSFAPFVLPRPTGPHRIGVLDFEVVDPGRAEPFRPDLAMRRRLMVRVWYPASPERSAPRRPYRTPLEALAMGERLAGALGLPATSFARVGAKPTHAVEGAPAAAAAAPFPILVFSHGYLGSVDTNTALMEALASHGVVAFSLTHPFESAAIVYPGGDVVALAAEVAAYMQGRTLDPDTATLLQSRDLGDRYAATQRLYSEASRLSESAPVWRDDFVSVVDALEAGRVPPEIGDILAQADLGRLIYAGMSFGGPAAIGACQIDPRCRGAINLDGREVTLTLFEQPVRAPTLMVYSGNAFNPTGLGYNDFFYEPVRDIGRRPEVRRAVVPDAGHWDFTDYTLLPKGEPSGPPLPPSLRGPIEGRRMIRLVNELLLDFVRRHAADPAAPLAESAQFDDALQLQDVSDIRRWAERR